MNTLKIFSILSVAVLIGLQSCEAPEGEGGSATLSGVLHTEYYNDDFSELLYTEEAVDKDVYLIYGTDAVLGDNIETLYDGTFRFEYLRKGDYSLYYYSDDEANIGAEKAVVHLVSIDKKKQELDLGTLIRKEALAWNDGRASISGNIRLINYYNFTEYPNLIVKDTSDAQEYEVYLTYGEHEVFDERIRTHHDGSFMFENLIPGDYDVFVYSEDTLGGTEHNVLHHSIEITEQSQEFTMETIFVRQL